MEIKNNTEKLLDTYFNANTMLCEHLDAAIYDGISDNREDEWNGDVNNPSWGEWDDEWAEWTYSEDGIRSHSKNGLIFIFCAFCTGDKGWLVFRESNILCQK